MAKYPILNHRSPQTLITSYCWCSSSYSRSVPAKGRRIPPPQRIAKLPSSHRVGIVAIVASQRLSLVCSILQLLRNICGWRHPRAVRLLLLHWEEQGLGWLEKSLTGGGGPRPTPQSLWIIRNLKTIKKASFVLQIPLYSYEFAIISCGFVEVGNMSDLS